MKLLLSFSGGKTSAYMTKWMLENKAAEYDEIKVVFANTGQEHEETLKFVNQCDCHWNLGVVWLESKTIHEKNKGSSFKVVNYETASRNGEPYEDMIKKYGIPNKSFPHCNRELKLNPINSYLRSIGWKKGSYQSAIGIRIDEMDRVSGKMKENNIIYPLIEYTKVTKELISLWWDRQPFNLDIPEHKGNCTWCWKKSKRKLMTLALSNPEYFEFPARMEKDYPLSGTNRKNEPRVFFRENISTEQLFIHSKEPFIPFRPKEINYDLYDSELDWANGCSEGCEIF